jgi:hypothetical protein
MSFEAPPETAFEEPPETPSTEPPLDEDSVAEPPLDEPPVSEPSIPEQPPAEPSLFDSTPPPPGEEPEPPPPEEQPHPPELDETVGPPPAAPEPAALPKDKAKPRKAKTRKAKTREAKIGQAKIRGGGAGFLVWSLLWLVLLAGAVYGALVFVHQTKLFPRYVRPVRENPTVQRTIGLIKRVPYLNYPFVDHGLERAVHDLIKTRVEGVPWLRRTLEPKPERQAPPRIRAKAELTIIVAHGRFVTSGRAGRLFVVEGKIKNIGQAPVSFIRLKGTLYVRDKRKQNVLFGKPVLAYAGVIFTADQFKRLSLKAIRARLDEKFGEQRTNYRLQPGHEINFMIVFDKLPLRQRLSEYVVQIQDSMAGPAPGTGSSR